jgi:toxin ParE1/3/4
VKPLILEEEAELELAGSIAFYEERMSGLGLDFEAAARRALKIITRAPKRWPIGKHGTRRFVMRRFPFVIHYLDMPDRIWIVAFAHTSRKPNCWKTRLPSQSE